jgi:DNA gyrase subunit B
VDAATLSDREKLNGELQKLQDRCEALFPGDMQQLAAALSQDTEHAGSYRVTLKSEVNGSPRDTVVDQAFLASPEYKELLRLRDGLKGLGAAPFTVVFESGEVTVQTVQELSRAIKEDAQKGLGIQRFKGLGEMNPEQLWETTMNPATRTLLQVKVEDTVESDEMFSLLMGEQVEPRREFIERNALEVQNLDI